MVEELSNLSRILSNILRHQPLLYKLVLDNEGWTSIESILQALRHIRPEWAALSENDLVCMINTSNKRRYEIHEGKIRALYGHSIDVKIKMKPVIPPDFLFHGTKPDLVPQIKSLGLLPMKRQYVHLSTDKEIAAQVGRRKTKQPLILKVMANKAYVSRVLFYQANEEVWLVDKVPKEFILFND